MFEKNKRCYPELGSGSHPKDKTRCSALGGIQHDRQWLLTRLLRIQ